MSWIKLDDQWMEHPKIIRAGRDARDMWLASITWCAKYLTDGEFPANLLPSLAASAGVDVANCQTFASTLIDVGLWDATPNGYAVHDYLKYNPSKQEVSDTREARKEAGKKGGEAKASKAASKKIAKVCPVPVPLPPAINQVNELNNLEEEGETSTSQAALSPDTIALSVYTGVTGFMAYPGGMEKNATKLWQFARSHGGITQAVEYLKPFYTTWTGRKTKDGRAYSRTGDGWIDWAIAGECPPETVKPEDKPLSGRESRRRLLTGV